jgi:hypothetical protein
VARHRVVEHQVAELAAVAARRVQADEGNALARFLEVHSVRAAAEGQPEISVRRWARDQPRAPPARRGAVITSWA